MNHDTYLNKSLHHNDKSHVAAARHARRECYWDWSVVCVIAFERGMQTFRCSYRSLLTPSHPLHAPPTTRIPYTEYQFYTFPLSSFSSLCLPSDIFKLIRLMLRKQPLLFCTFATTCESPKLATYRELGNFATKIPADAQPNS